MPRGAAPGERRGGRAKGTLNKRTLEQVRAIEESGLTPLEYLMSVVRDTNADQAVRIDAAGKAAPYVHPRLATTEISLNTSGKHVEEMTNAQIEAIVRGETPNLPRSPAA